MKKQTLGLVCVFALSAALFACGPTTGGGDATVGDSGGGASDASSEVSTTDAPVTGDTGALAAGHCDFETSTAPNTGCAQFADGTTEATAQALCTQAQSSSGGGLGGMYSAGPCRTMGRIARCLGVMGFSAPMDFSFYEPMTLEQATGACAAGMGMLRTD